MPDAVVVGAGPNGLAAAIALAQAGRTVLVLEAAETVGGGSRSDALTLPGFVHDVCSAVHPHPLASPFLRSLPLAEHGLELVQPDLPAAHPLDDGTAVAFARSIDETADSIGGKDGARYRKLVAPLVRDAEKLFPAILGPLRPPRHPLALTRFGLRGLPSAKALTRRFDGERAPALIAGHAAHSMLRLDQSPTSAVALVLMLTGHHVGWPVARGGSQAIADALASLLRSLGGEIETGRRVESVDELGERDACCSTSRRSRCSRSPATACRRATAARSAATATGPASSSSTGRSTARSRGRRRSARRAGTVHLGGTFEEIAASEAAASAGSHAERPFVLLSQPTVCDPSRAPAGKHTAWAYCHVPSGSDARHDRERSRRRSSASPPASATACWPARRCTRARWRPTTPTTSAATSTAA